MAHAETTGFLGVSPLEGLIWSTLMRREPSDLKLFSAFQMPVLSFVKCLPRAPNEQCRSRGFDQHLRQLNKGRRVTQVLTFLCWLDSRRPFVCRLSLHPVLSLSKYQPKAPHFHFHTEGFFFFILYIYSIWLIICICIAKTLRVLTMLTN